jgi:hypothetical protein
MEKKPGSGMNIPDHISKSLVKIFLHYKYGTAKELPGYQVMEINFFKPFPIPTNLPSHTSLPLLFVPSFSSQFLFTHPIVFSSVGPSVGDPGCLSQIPDPDFYPSRIPNLDTRSKNSNKRKG